MQHYARHAVLSCGVWSMQVVASRHDHQNIQLVSCECHGSSLLCLKVDMLCFLLFFSILIA